MFMAGGSKRDTAENIAIKLPIFNKVIFDSSFSDTFGIMARLISGNVPPMQTIEILAKASSIKKTQSYWKGVSKN